MAKSRKSRQSRKMKKSSSRKQKQRGGTYGFTGATIGPAGTISNYGQQWQTIGKPLTPDCVAASKSDIMGYSGPVGLPGLSGGRRRRQTGGRYGFDLSAQVAPATPALGGIPPVQRIACEGSTPNPLNPGPHTPSTQPPIQGGGGQLGGLGSPDLAYYAPTAGYANAASSWVSSVGAPVQIQVPYEARAWNPACLKTGGGKKRSRSTSKKTRKGRKGKKGSRKH